MDSHEELYSALTLTFRGDRRLCAVMTLQTVGYSVVAYCDS